MRIIKNPDMITCDICGCVFEITEKDVCTDLGGVYMTGPTTTKGQKFVFCPICKTRIYLKEKKKNDNR